MDFKPSDRILEITARMRSFVERELLPLEPQLLQDGFGSLIPLLDVKRAQVRALGLWAPNHPREYGGMGLDLVDHGLVSEVLGRTPLGHYAFGCNAPDAGNIELLHQFGTEAQKGEWLPKLVGGQMRSCFGMTERNNSGANPLFLETRAERRGDEYIINGEKWFTTGADGSGLCIVMAVTDPDGPPHQRASMILVPTNTPGYVFERNTKIMGHADQGLFSHAEIRFDDCRVPAANRLGGEGEGFRLAQVRLGPGRIHHCMRWLGICARSLDMLAARATQRVIGERDRRLIESDIIKAWIAECAAEIEAARLLTLQTAWRIEREGAKAARNDISMIKYYVAGILQRVVDRALQAHGGLGMTDYTVLAWFYREERASRIYDGPDEVHKLAVARRIIRGGDA